MFLSDSIIWDLLFAFCLNSLLIQGFFFFFFNLITTCPDFPATCHLSPRRGSFFVSSPLLCFPFSLRSSSSLLKFSLLDSIGRSWFNRGRIFFVLLLPNRHPERILFFQTTLPHQQSTRKDFWGGEEIDSIFGLFLSFLAILLLL